MRAAASVQGKQEVKRMTQPGIHRMNEEDALLAQGPELVSAPAPQPMRLSVVIPVFNERVFIKEILLRVQASDLADEIIIVDDASTDGTRELLQELQSLQASGQLETGGGSRNSLRLDNIRFIFQSPNQGKGAALRRGFEEATGDIFLVQDADLEYDPKDYPTLLAPILDGRADVVFGSRFLGDQHRVLYYWHSVANHYLTTLSNMFTNLNLTDMETCYKVFRRDVLRKMTFEENRFGFEPEITAKVSKK